MSPTAAKPRARARAHRRDVFHRGTQDFRQLGRLDKRESFSRSVFAHDMGMSLQRGPKQSPHATARMPHSAGPIPIIPETCHWSAARVEREAGRPPQQPPSVPTPPQGL